MTVEVNCQYFYKLHQLPFPLHSLPTSFPFFSCLDTHALLCTALCLLFLQGSGERTPGGFPERKPGRVQCVKMAFPAVSAHRREKSGVHGSFFSGLFSRIVSQAPAFITEWLVEMFTPALSLVGHWGLTSWLSALDGQSCFFCSPISSTLGRHHV